MDAFEYSEAQRAHERGPVVMCGLGPSRDGAVTAARAGRQAFFALPGCPNDALCLLLLPAAGVDPRRQLAARHPVLVVPCGGPRAGVGTMSGARRRHRHAGRRDRTGGRACPAAAGRVVRSVAARVLAACRAAGLGDRRVAGPGAAPAARLRQSATAAEGAGQRGRAALQPVPEFRQGRRGHPAVRHVRFPGTRPGHVAQFLAGATDTGRHAVRRAGSGHAGRRRRLRSEVAGLRAGVPVDQPADDLRGRGSLLPRAAAGTIDSSPGAARPRCCSGARMPQAGPR